MVWGMKLSVVWIKLMTSQKCSVSCFTFVSFYQRDIFASWTTFVECLLCWWDVRVRMCLGFCKHLWRWETVFQCLFSTSSLMIDFKRLHLLQSKTFWTNINILFLCLLLLLLYFYDIHWGTSNYCCGIFFRLLN